MFLMALGAVTSLIAGVSGTMELDIKKVVALSTLRQLGVMFFSLGAGNPRLAFFHLVAHAFFKAILFIAAGALIHSMGDYQDTRLMGGGESLVVAKAVVLLARISLAGLPFLTGFYSKDLILEVFMIGKVNLFILLVIIASTALTAAYSWRLGASVFFGEHKGASCRGAEDIRG